MQGVKAHPRDYLNVFCLGNREPVEPNAPPPPKSAKPKSRQVIASGQNLASPLATAQSSPPWYSL
jgi:hypothetical protein